MENDYLIFTLVDPPNSCLLHSITIVSIHGEHISAVTGPTRESLVNSADGRYVALPDRGPNPVTHVLDLFGALGLWLLSIMAMYLVPAIVALPYIIYRYSGSSDLSQSLASDHTVLLLSVIGVFPAHVLTFVAAWVLVTMRGRRSFWEAIGWSFGEKFGFFTAAGVAGALYLAGAILAKLIGGGPTDIDVLVNSSLAVRLLLAVLATTTGPLVEEIVYRGILYPALQKYLGMAWAVALVSFLFALVHVYQYRNSAGVIAVIVMLSISLTLVRAFTGRLLPSFIIHMVFNGIVSVLIVFQPYIDQLEKSAAPKTGLVMLWRLAHLIF